MAATANKKSKVEQPKYLPEHIIRIILLSLPVKSLIRFKTVEKSWLRLITEVDFAKDYRTRAGYKCIASVAKKLYEVSYLYSDGSQKNMCPHVSCELVGSARGLLCLRHERNFSV